MTYADFRRTENSLAANHEGAEDREALEAPVCDGCQDDSDLRCTDVEKTIDGDMVCMKCSGEFERLRRIIEGVIRGERWSTDEELEGEINDCLSDIEELKNKVGGLCVDQEVRGFRYEGNPDGMEQRLRAYYDLVKEGTGNE